MSGHLRPVVLQKIFTGANDLSNIVICLICLKKLPD